MRVNYIHTVTMATKFNNNITRRGLAFGVQSSLKCLVLYLQCVCVCVWEGETKVCTETLL